MGAALLEARGLRAQLNDERGFEVSLTLGRGECLQVCGPSGAGKSTLLRMLARLDGRAGGELLLEGRPDRELLAPAWRRQVVYLAQQPTMLEGTVRDNLGAGFRAGRARVPSGWEVRASRMLEQLLLPPGELLDQQAATLSGGEASRVAVVRALLIEPAVLLADEPTAALDLEAGTALVQLLHGWVATGALVFVAHDSTPWDGIGRTRLELER